MSFNLLNLNKSILNALEDLGLTHPTEIQERVFPAVMSGRDICGIAQTGTGKTFGYLLPLLRMWNFSKDKLPQILIIVPTRELVLQVVDEAKKLAKYINFDIVGVYGGVNTKPQIADLAKGSDLIVATPGRFIDLVAAGALKTKNVKKLVIDEFDVMLDLGFMPQLEAIFEKIPSKRQNLLFSATLSSDVDILLSHHFNNPILIETNDAGTASVHVNQKAFLVPNFKTKLNLLELLLYNDKSMLKNLIFAPSKEQADLIKEHLVEFDDVDIIHSNKSQNYRINAIRSFENGDTKTLIATDLGSRGIDLLDVSHVINFNIPDNPEDYLHRIGRTGRSQKSGNAVSFCTEKEKEYLENIEKFTKQKIEIAALPNQLEISNEVLFFEAEVEIIKQIPLKKKVNIGASFHDKLEKNKKVNVRRNIEEEKKKKYGKGYKKRHE